MKTINMLAVTPYEGLADFFVQCARSFPDIRLDVFTENLQAAVQNVERYTGYDIVVSRGGTAQILKEKLTIPVIEVEVSVYDMLRVIKMAQQTNKSFAIMGFYNMVKISKIVCEIMQYNVPTYTISSEEDAGRFIAALEQTGVELVVGDVVTTNLATQAGIPSLLITSGAESVEKSFHDTIHLFQNMEKLNRISPYKDVLDNSPHKIAVFDSNKRLFYANPAFQSLKMSGAEAFLRDSIPRLDIERTVRLHRHQGSCALDIAGIRLDGAGLCWYTFYVASCARVFEHEDCIKIESPDRTGHQAAAPAFLDAERVCATIAKTLVDGKRQSPVIILGEAGTGVEAFARNIHASGEFMNSLFITIDCRSLNEKRWHDIVGNADSPLHGLKCTIFFRNIHLLDYSVQNMLCNYIEDTLLTKRHHVISSSSSELTPLMAANGFLPALYQKLNGLSVRLPSLSERPEEIPTLASLFINHYNREFTKQVIGFENEALEFLKNYHWEFNLEQLQDVIRQMVIITDKSYITLTDVKSNFTKIQNISPVSHQINLNQTFEEIEKGIIRYVLAEEGMNQSRAAKRLGIGRSTLWRKISNTNGL